MHAQVFIILVFAVAVSSAFQPNIIFFLADDLGYGDLNSYGHPSQEWGPIDDLAKDGMRFTSMYTASSLCSPSRAALLTGRLPVRIGAYGKYMDSYHSSPNGLPKEEVTLPEMLRETGYATGMVGKWHLGINDYEPMSGAHLPRHHGFDWVGTNLPYTNVWECDESKRHMDAPDPNNCFLYKNETIVQQPFSHGNLTAMFVDDAKTFIGRHIQDDKPFFLFISFAHNHVSMFKGENKMVPSRRGIYGDNLQEMSWAVGEIMTQIRTSGIDNDTLVYFTSDNGAHVEICNEGGDNGILKGGKATYYEGGIRVPGIMRWPGKITAGSVNSAVVSQMDMYTTLAKITGSKIPTDRIVDGQDISESILGTKVDDVNRVLFFYCNDILFAVRYGAYKVHFKTMPVKSKQEYGELCGEGGFPIEYYFNCLYCPSDCVIVHRPPLIFDVEADPSEVYSLNPSSEKKLLKEVFAAIKDHKSILKKGEPLYSTYWAESQPCCDLSAPSCTCNYP